MEVEETSIHKDLLGSSRVVHAVTQHSRDRGRMVTQTVQLREGPEQFTGADPRLCRSHIYSQPSFSQIFVFVSYKLSVDLFTHPKQRQYYPP